MIELSGSWAHRPSAPGELRQSIDAWRAAHGMPRATWQELLYHRQGELHKARRRYEADWQEMMRRYQEAVSAFHRAVEIAGRRAEGRSPRPNAPLLAPRPRPAASRTRADAPAAMNADELTARQREIARLIAAGLTNRQIAGELVLTEGTVANHVRHILLRLGMRCRAQVAVWVVAPLRSPRDRVARAGSVSPPERAAVRR